MSSGPSVIRRAGVDRTAAVYGAREGDFAPSSPFRGLRWSLSLVAVLVYMFVITSYRIRIGDVAMAVALLGLIMEPGGFRFTPFLTIFGMLWLWCAAGMVSSPWPLVVKDELIVMGKLWLIALALVNTIRGRKRVRFFMLFFVLVFALYPARGSLFNFFLAGYGLDGRAIWNYIYANPNDMAALTLLQLSIAAALLVREPKGIYRLGALAAVVVLTFIILLTQSRGVFIGLLAFGALALGGHHQRAKALGLGLAVILAAAMFLPSSAWQRLGEVTQIGDTSQLSQINDEGSAEQRFEIWKTSFRIIEDHPITGVGIGAYPEANAAYSPRLGRRDTHSTYFNVMAETGGVGFLLFLGMVGAAVIRAERVRRRISAQHPLAARQIRLLELGLLGYLIAGVFGSYARLSFLYIQLVLVIAVAEANDVPLRPRRNRMHHRVATRRPVPERA